MNERDIVNIRVAVEYFTEALTRDPTKNIKDLLPGGLSSFTAANVPDLMLGLDTVEVGLPLEDDEKEFFSFAVSFWANAVADSVGKNASPSEIKLFYPRPQWCNAKPMKVSALHDLVGVITSFEVTELELLSND